MNTGSFAQRHIGPSSEEITKMLGQIGESSLEDLIDKTIPKNIRLSNELNVSNALTEQEYLTMLQEKASKNSTNKSYIGLGYYGTVVPSVILRNVLENPGWYTAYTPYQAEIAQGRLEALLNFQTMVMDLTGMEIANASLLDEGTAAAESMMMFYNTRSRAAIKAGANKFFIAEDSFPQTIDTVKTRAKSLSIDLVIGDHKTIELDETFFGAVVQYPNTKGHVNDLSSFISNAHEKAVKVAVGADIMSLVLLTAPGKWNADVVFGNTQRFGVPMGYGGPHAAYLATKEDYKRHIPGRIIGVSKDRQGRNALRMALQTREQHIRRDKATSNICTAQALLAVMAGMYAVYHGPQGMKQIAEKIHANTVFVAEQLEQLGLTIEKGTEGVYFDTLTLSGVDVDALQKVATENKINLRFDNDGQVGLSIDETCTDSDIELLINTFAKAVGKGNLAVKEIALNSIINGGVKREGEILTNSIFHTYRSETDMMRYLKKLENRDLSLTHSMIPLGSCTMKLNAASELMPITWPEFANVHPFVPKEQAQGYQEILKELEADLCAITGFDAVSLQPNSGAQGEYAGLMVIKAYHEHRGDHHRNIVLIPSSAHGTNPASAVVAGMKVVVTKCDDLGNIDVTDLKAKAEQHKDNLAALMVTYPSTHGVFEEAITEITSIIHDNGGKVYMDGANMNAQVGLTNPGNIGADVCHLNLHKTFAIPHGGGGPGMGPIGVTKDLAPFLPGNPIIETGGEHAINAISAAPYGSSLILLISYGYIKMLGKNGLTDSTKLAILNANYIKSKLSSDFDILYTGVNNTVAHEMIVDCRDYKKTANIEVEDIAKRLIDYGFHAPTVSFPVAGTIMVEPTESESKDELDRFCEALLMIRAEIQEIEDGRADSEQNVLKNAPHTAEVLLSNKWEQKYSREKAAYPVKYIREAKFWPSVSRIDNALGDRNLICSCPEISEYEAELV